MNPRREKKKTKKKRSSLDINKIVKVSSSSSSRSGTTHDAGATMFVNSADRGSSYFDERGTIRKRKKKQLEHSYLLMQARDKASAADDERKRDGKTHIYILSDFSLGFSYM